MREPEGIPEMSRRAGAVDGLAHVLGQVRSKGVRLWAANGQLHYTAPKGALAAEEIAVLRGSRSQIVAHLETEASAQAAEGPPAIHPRFHYAPCTFSQLAHWHMYELASRQVLRHVVHAVRLLGELDREALSASFLNLIGRHDALRTQVFVDQGMLLQKVARSCPFELEVDDLMAFSPNSCTDEAERLIESFLLTRIDVTVDPLFGARLIRLRHDEHLLVVAVEHFVSDGSSMNILFRELLTGYAQASKGLPISLPPVQLQLSDYAACQRNAHVAWLREHGAYWNERMKGCQRARFPASTIGVSTTATDWGSVPVRIHSDTTKALREWCRLNQTTVVMAVFAGYAAFVLRWCSLSEAVFQYIIGGRDSPKLENSIGYFASALHLRIALREDDVFADFANHVIGEYCSASEHVDYSYIEAQEPRPGFTRNSFFNWLPKGEPPVEGELQTTLVSTPFEVRSPIVSERDSEPCMVLREEGTEIGGVVLFPVNRISVHDMERFVRSFTHLVRELFARPTARVKKIWLP